MTADSGKDRLGEKLKDLEHAREDIFFAERDRQLIDKLRAQAGWHAEVNDFLVLVQAVASGAVPLAALRPNQEFLDGEAATKQQSLAIPGVRPVQDVPA